ncbi:hypothetical protein GCM10022198_22230 [Klugiella xanthotipulae]
MYRVFTSTGVARVGYEVGTFWFSTPVTVIVTTVATAVAVPIAGAVA